MSKALATKNVAAVLLGVAMVFGVAFSFATPAKADVISDLQAQIQALLAQIAALQAGSTGSTGGACVNFTFTANLEQGDSSAEVMQLQKFLNTSADTQVASTGAGSPGNETNYFGGLTKAAVIKFQEKYAADVLTPVGLSSGTGYWGPSSRAKANALAATCTPGSNNGGTGTTTGGNLMVSAATQPANSLAPEGAARVPFTSFTLTNTSNAAVTVNGVTVQRTGLANDAAFAGVVLVDANGQQLGVSRTFNSNHQATIGDGFIINPGQSMTLTVAANMQTDESAYSGQVASISVVGVNSNGTVGGSLPISGAQQTINSSLSIGDVTAARGALDPNVDLSKPVGETDYTFSSVRLTAGSAEDVKINSIRWNQSGSASASDLSGVEVVVDGTSYPATVSSDGKYYTATFNGGIVIQKGLSKEFSIRGDVVSGAGRTVQFDIYRSTDISATGQTFGYGISPTAGTGFTANATPTYSGSTVTVQAGSVQSISRSNAVATGNVAPLVSNTALGAFTISIQGEPVNVQTATVSFALSGAVGTDVDLVTLVDQNGAVLAGPVDATGSGTTGTATFSGFTLPVGTSVLTVKGQLASAFGAGDTIVASIDLSTWSGITGQTTGNSITLSGSATANTQTVKAADLDATTLTTPVASNVVAGAVDVDFMHGLLNASNSGEDIRVTAIKVDHAGTGDVTDIDNAEIWADLTSANSARGDKYETKVSNTTQLSTASTNFTLTTPVTVAKGTSVEVALIGDINSSAGNAETHTFDLNTVTAVGSNTGSSVTPTVTGGGQAMTISSGGVLTVTVDGSSPASSIMLDNTSAEQTIAVFRLDASNVEDISIKSLALGKTGTSNDESVREFRLYNGSTLVKSVVNDGQATTTVQLQDGDLVVPKNSNVKLTVKAVMANIDGTAVQNGNTVGIQVGSTTATGLDSQSSLSDNEAYNTVTHTVYEAYPTFAFESVNGVLAPSANTLVAKLVVTNTGDKDVTFDGSDGDQIVMNFTISGTITTGSASTTLTDASNGQTLDANADLSANTGNVTATFDFGTNDLTIPAGGSKTLNVTVNTSGLSTDGNSIQAWLDDSAASNLEFSIDNDGGDYNEGDVIFRGDIFSPTTLVNP